MRIGCSAKEQDGRGTGGPRAERGAKDTASGDDGAEELGFKKFSDEVRNSHGAPAEKIEDAGFAEAAYAAAGLQKIPEIFRRGLVDRGRSNGSELFEETGGFFERLGELRVFRGVFVREAGDSRGGSRGVIVEKQRFAIGRWSKDAGIGRKNFILEFLELQIARDVGMQRAEGVR